ncbi:MAG: class I SAM-dependent methyltransferase [Candidatus Loosdrechtia sp.]|uniref:class I SAM-dependent methyltransferase n=1 Tax=Candidatus Loosdrechtia sp. TaxID=3101272 RepID=UPI003A6F5994|nr:MAG: SAM-dependent methyltransferase [Candidatus Jettenia sp. AMX2]
MTSFKKTIGEELRFDKKFSDAIALKVEQSGSERDVKKLNEVIGFCEQILPIIQTYPPEKEIVFLECSCGKSYLSFALNYVLAKYYQVNAYFYGTDINQILIEKCCQLSDKLEYNNMRFITGRIIDVKPEKPVDMVLALHACDTATDETIAKGIKLKAKYIIVVPCCENQIRSRIKRGHPLADITDFGLLRYRFADILTEALRAQFLTGAGYYVKFTEVINPKITPKNLMIIARRKKGNIKYNMNSYKKLNKMFNTNFILEDYFDEFELN